MSQPAPVQPTHTHQMVGASIDVVPTSFVDLHAWEDREVALGGFRRAETADDRDAMRELMMELGFFDLCIPPKEPDALFRRNPAGFAAHYGFADETPTYAARRLQESAHPVLRVRYLEYLLSQTPKGRDWIRRQRELAEAYRAYVEHARAHLAPGVELGGGEFEEAVQRTAVLIGQSGVLTTGELTEWAHWIVGVAQFLHDFPWAVTRGAPEFHAHRWPFAILRNLVALPAKAIAQEDRDAALASVDAAYGWFSIQPLSDTFTAHVADADAALRKHFGEKDTAERRVRRTYDALLQRARLHEQTGSGALTQTFVRTARALAEEHRQYFTDEEIAQLGRWEQRAIRGAVQGQEFKRVTATVSDIPSEVVDWSGGTPTETVVQIVRTSAQAVPDHAELQRQAESLGQDAPLASMLDTTVIGGDKVVGETTNEEERRALRVEQLTTIHAQFTGRALATTVRSAIKKHGLTADDLLAPFLERELGESTVQLLHRGLERFLAEDYISALHILAPRVEALIRDQLNTLGFDTTKFRTVGDGNATRTDDLTFGTLLRKTGPGGRTVEQVLGTDLWRYVQAIMNSPTGMNLRNVVAHGLIPAGGCTGAAVSVTVHILYALAVAFASPDSGSGGPE